MEIMNKIYLLAKKYITQEKHAGNKALKDCENIARRFDFQDIEDVIPDGRVNKSVSYYLDRMLRCVIMFFRLARYRNKIIVAGYPRAEPWILKNTYKKFFISNKSILIVHDVESWRFEESRIDDFDVLNNANVLIVHNDKMKNRLIESGVNKPHMIILDLFDYLLDNQVDRKKYKKAVVFAGNLKKSKFFLNEYINTKRNYDLDLYGVGIKENEKLPMRTHYHGGFSPEELPNVIDRGFGLVWDGDSIDTCSGKLGEYTRYNNPHKLSLYIAAGIPVIVWKYAAIAEFVEKNRIGYCVESLKDIDKLLNNISSDEYKILQNNIKPLQKRITKGDFLTKALQESLKYVHDM